MCGFYGYFSLDKKIDPQILYRNISLEHRGPDDHRIYKDKNLYCEFFRLEILGGKQGVQPIISKNKRYLLLFNGEIFNFKELAKTYLGNNTNYKSDTKVLLDLLSNYGVEIAKKLNGMYSIVFYDLKLKKIYLIRDKFGTKPLYYSIEQNILYFASEIKGIPIKKNIDKSVLCEYLDLGYYPIKKTFYKNIQNLEASKYLIYGKNTLTKVKYFDLRNEVKKEKKEKIASLEKFDFLLERSIKIRQRSNRHLNFHLSGGIDSTSLVILTNQFWKKKYDLTTSTYYYKGFNANENKIAKKIASKLNIKNIQTEVTPEDIPYLSEKLQKYQDEPFGGLASVAEFKQNIEQRENQNIVSFEGIGGDEILGGYNSHLYLYIYDLYASKKNNYLLSKLVKFSGKKLGHIIKTAKKFIKSGFNGNTDLSQIIKIDDNNINKNYKYFEKILYKEILDGSLFRTLRFRDRSSAACGRELRFPFLDHELLIHSLAIPPELKFNHGMTKSPLRRVVSGLDKKLSLERKKSANSAQSHWFKNHLKDWVLDNINTLNNKNVIDKKYFKGLSSYFNESSKNTFYLWQLVNLNLFFENLKKQKS